MPPGFRLVKGPDTWGKPLEPLPQPANQGPQRPGVPHEQFAFDRAPLRSRPGVQPTRYYRAHAEAS